MSETTKSSCPAEPPTLISAPTSVLRAVTMPSIAPATGKFSCEKVASARTNFTGVVGASFRVSLGATNA